MLDEQVALLWIAGVTVPCHHHSHHHHHQHRISKVLVLIGMPIDGLGEKSCFHMPLLVPPPPAHSREAAGTDLGLWAQFGVSFAISAMNSASCCLSFCTFHAQSFTP